jgi:hypothetical protein
VGLVVETQPSAKMVHLGHALTSQRHLPLERYVTRGGVFKPLAFFFPRPAQCREGAGTGEHVPDALGEIRPPVTQQYTHSSGRNKVYLTHPKDTYALFIANCNLW